MATEQWLKSISAIAGSDLSAAQYEFVDINSSSQLVVPTGVGAKVLGVLQDKPSAQGRVGQVAINGVSKIKLGATLAAGVQVSAGTDGRAIAVLTGHRTQGTLLEGGVANDIVPMALNINGGQIN